VSGTRKSDAGFLSRAGIKDLPAHVAGHKTVILAVEQQDRNVCVPHRLNGSGCFGSRRMDILEEKAKRNVIL